MAKKINKDWLTVVFVLICAWIFIDAIYVAASLISWGEVFGQKSFFPAFVVSIGVELMSILLGILILTGLWSFHKTIFKGLKDENSKKDSSK